MRASLSPVRSASKGGTTCRGSMTPRDEAIHSNLIFRRLKNTLEMVCTDAGRAVNELYDSLQDIDNVGWDTLFCVCTRTYGPYEPLLH